MENRHQSCLSHPLNWHLVGHADTRTYKAANVSMQDLDKVTGFCCCYCFLMSQNRQMFKGQSTEGKSPGRRYGIKDLGPEITQSGYTVVLCIYSSADLH